MMTDKKITQWKLIDIKHFIKFNLMRLSSKFYFSEREVKFSSIKKIKKNSKKNKKLNKTYTLLE